MQVLAAEGDLQTVTMSAQGITLEGTAKAEAEKAMQMAPIAAQIELATQIGENQGYQQYLITIKQIEANQAVGIEQAKSLAHADIKVIANSGDVSSGISSLGDIISSKGGTKIGAMLEALNQSPVGQDLITKILPSTKAVNSTK